MSSSFVHMYVILIQFRFPMKSVSDKEENSKGIGHKLVDACSSEGAKKNKKFDEEEKFEYQVRYLIFRHIVCC